MNVVSAELERAIRYYRWMLDYMEWEQSHAFPVMQLVAAPSTLGLILHLMRLDVEGRRRLIKLFVKSAHPLAVDRLREPLRVDEAREIGVVQRQASSFVELMRNKRLRAARADEPWNRNRLTASLRSTFDGFFNSEPQAVSAQSFRYEVELGDWIVRTQFEFSSRLIDKAIYFHSVRRVDADPHTLAELGPVDMFEETRPEVVQRLSKPHQGTGSLMQGAGFGPCTFELLSRSDEDAMVTAAKAHAERFWFCIQSSIDGLGIDD